MAQNNAFRLNCAVQSYGWGKIGTASEAAKLSQTGNDTFKVEESTPYAELWMGTHPKGPSMIATTGEALSDWLKSHPETIGNEVIREFPVEGQLPFLFKVLSVNKSLSIQAHPNKLHAEKLHSERPDKYPDPNHKPEMAIALTQFEGLCGFRPKHEILGFLDTVAELRAIVGDANAVSLTQSTNAEEEKLALRKCFEALMTCEADTVKQQVETLATRIQSAGALDEDSRELFLRLHSQFPGDCGCFVIFFLNHMRLQPGDSMYLAANLPHAYLSGDCLECMACSDNVVRAGLTPKFKDVPTLVSMLNYSCKPAKDNIFESKKSEDPCVTVFSPPIPDFGVHRVQVLQAQKYTLSAMPSASISIVIQGSGTASNIDLTSGSVFFLAADEQLDIKVGGEGLLLFRAYCSL